MYLHFIYVNSLRIDIHPGGKNQSFREFLQNGNKLNIAFNFSLHELFKSIKFAFSHDEVKQHLMCLQLPQSIELSRFIFYHQFWFCCIELRHQFELSVVKKIHFVFQKRKGWKERLWAVRHHHYTWNNSSVKNFITLAVGTC